MRLIIQEKYLLKREKKIKTKKHCENHKIMMMMNAVCSVLDLIWLDLMTFSIAMFSHIEEEISLISLKYWQQIGKSQTNEENALRRNTIKTLDQWQTTNEQQQKNW